MISFPGHMTSCQMVVCSATLHNVEVKKLAVSMTVNQYPMPGDFPSLPLSQEKIMHFPTWVDLKGQDSVPETVHHVVCRVDPLSDTSWHSLSRTVQV